jgi:hypothetical protein
MKTQFVLALLPAGFLFFGFGIYAIHQKYEGSMNIVIDKFQVRIEGKPSRHP